MNDVHETNVFEEYFFTMSPEELSKESTVMIDWFDSVLNFYVDLHTVLNISSIELLSDYK